LIALLTAAVALPERPLTITHLTGDFYIYTTYKMLESGPFPSNSMYVVTKDGVIMIDTPWDVEQTLPLLDSIERRHRKPVVLCVVTHHHDDRTAGLDILKARGIPTWSTARTLQLCREKSEKEAGHSFTRDTTFTVGGVSFQTYYPGEGHTADNMVIWFPKSRVLYGGCFVKSSESRGLGNIADANVEEWPESVRKVIKRFRRPAFIIPGHQSWKGRDALKHTLRLLKESER
jgi:metallo-beta-lactamase class B